MVSYQILGIIFTTGWLVGELALHVTVLNGVVTTASLWLLGDAVSPEFAFAVISAVGALCGVLLVNYVRILLDVKRQCDAIVCVVERFERANELAPIDAKLDQRRRATRLPRLARELFRLLVVAPHLFHDDVVSIERDVRYADYDDRLVLDVYRRRRSSSSSSSSTSSNKRPIVLYVHGGAWIHGTKAHSPPMLSYLAARGFVCFSAQYRL